MVQRVQSVTPKRKFECKIVSAGGEGEKGDDRGGEGGPAGEVQGSGRANSGKTGMNASYTSNGLRVGRWVTPILTCVSLKEAAKSLIFIKGKFY